jgi:SAM-dependent methyltransferase
MTEDDPLYRDPSLVQFYDVENGAWDDFDFCVEMAGGARSVLDLGCGTGQLATMLADGRRVVGVDPAGAMLNVARSRAGGEKVHWVEAAAQDVRLGEAFDLVLLTGHAFQVFLTDADALNVLKTIAVHLAPGGRFVFDTRNPGYRAWESWTPEASKRVVRHLDYGEVRAWNNVHYEPATAIATYQTFYEITSIGKTLSASSQIRFVEKDRLAELIKEAGLRADRWLGDWRGAPWQASSREIIPVGGLVA